MDNYFLLIISLILILILVLPFVYLLGQEYNIENYDISNAILIDNFITYNRAGSPSYYLVYKFEDTCIKQFEVIAEQYYVNISSKNEEGS